MASVLSALGPRHYRQDISEMTGWIRWTNGKSKWKIMETKKKAQCTAGTGAVLGDREAKIKYMLPALQEPGV